MDDRKIWGWYVAVTSMGFVGLIVFVKAFKALFIDTQIIN